MMNVDDRHHIPTYIIRRIFYCFVAKIATDFSGRGATFHVYAMALAKDFTVLYCKLAKGINYLGG